MHRFARHDLLYVTSAGRDRVCAILERECGGDGPRMAGMFASGRIPAIVRRMSACDQPDIGVGIAFPFRANGTRRRFATAITETEVETRLSPFSIPANGQDASIPVPEAFRRILDLAFVPPDSLGPFGACALQIVTGMPYLDERSDIDLLIHGQGLAALERANAALAALEETLNLKIDTEVILPSGFGVKLKELFSEQKSILVKSVSSVDVIDMCVVRQALPEDVCVSL